MHSLQYFKGMMDIILDDEFVTSNREQNFRNFDRNIAEISVIDGDR